MLYVADFGATVRTVAQGPGSDMVVGTRWKGKDAPSALVADASARREAIGDRVIPAFRRLADIAAT